MILHVATAEAWAEAKARGSYAADSLATEGFVHCCDERQLAGVAQRYFRGRRGLLVLHIDPSRLTADVRYENLVGGAELFPHVYGGIPVGAVVDVTALGAHLAESG